MKRHEIHFFVDGTGGIESTVIGVSGSGCRHLVERLDGLGRRIDAEPTADYFDAGTGRVTLRLRPDADG
jgi:hypothetical protein